MKRHSPILRKLIKIVSGSGQQKEPTVPNTI